jgi:cytochrome oxidase assembly protein ShyY1
VYRFLLTPRWLGITLFAVVAIPVCLFMGSWQLSRFDARVASTHKQQKTVADSAHARARPLAELLPVDLTTSGRPAEATGRYDAGHPLLVPGRQLGEKSGYYVLSLLRTRTSPGQNDGKALPVVRGWLPGHPNPAKVPPPPRGEVTVTGALQPSESPGSPGVSTDGALPKGQLGMISAAALVNVVPYDVYNAWITVRTTPAGTALKPVPPAQPDNSGLDVKAFQNLGYTGEWFVFAGFVVFMWFRFFRRDVELAKDAALGLVPEPGSRPHTETAPDSQSECQPECQPGTTPGSRSASGTDGPEQLPESGDSGSGTGTSASSGTGTGDANGIGTVTGDANGAGTGAGAGTGDASGTRAASPEGASERSQSPASTA